MERMIPPSTEELLGGTIGDDLDRIEVKVGKIGMNSAQNALSLLSEFDSVWQKISALDQGDTRKALTAQFDASLAKLQKEAAGFLRDIGGLRVYQEARAAAQPGAHASWWFLDEYLHQKRKALMRRMGITGGIILLALVILGVVYQVFLAPDPDVVARYTSERAAQENLLYGNLEQALEEAEKGLQVAPQDSALLIYKGVILEVLGRSEEAAVTMEKARAVTGEEEFFLLRAQSYLAANRPENALADALQAISVNPNSVQGYLLAGQAHEVLGEFATARDEYEKAFSLANASDQSELAAIARMRIAMLLQMMSSQLDLPQNTQEPSPGP